MQSQSSASEIALDFFSSLPNEAGVRLPTFCKLAGCSPATAWRYVKAGRVRTRKLSAGITVFNVGSIREFLNSDIK